MPDVISIFELSDGVQTSLQEFTEGENLTRDSIIETIREELNDQGYFYSSDDLVDSIQDAYIEIAAFSGCIEKAVEIPWQSNRTYWDLIELIPDFLSLVAIWNTNNKRWLVPATIRQLDKMDKSWEKTTGQPILFSPLSYRYVAIYPRLISATGSMYVFYKAVAPVITGSDTFQIPPDICSDLLQSYVTCDLLEQAEEFKKAQLRYEEYLDSLEKLRVRIERFQAERLSRLGGSL